MAEGVHGDVTRVGHDLRTGTYVTVGTLAGHTLKSKVADIDLKQLRGSKSIAASHLARRKRPIRGWKRSTPAPDSAPRPIVFADIPVELSRGVQVPAGLTHVVVWPTGHDAAVADLPANVQEYTKALLVQLELKLQTRLSAIDAADIDLSALGPVDELAESMMSQLPASHAFDEAIGPFYDEAGAAKRMHVSADTLQARVLRDEVLACPTAEGDVVFPTFQFNADGTVLPGLDAVLRALAAGTKDRWQVALWLSTPNEQLRGLPPRVALKTGASQAVLKVAEQTAERWCH
ncbi:hypothetical protein [Mycolicibacterium llatzerense]|uniref:hypothetical protein n=1 Tax=Mycolicibacterium llatzerense TaxID=280871 RepID=UPI0021B5B53D|nr:hypothetical protein [Mycolicibacterium llatzerense]MCT7367359.1 hypothetical protein [Mycolicibacterium llatzerense]